MCLGGIQHSGQAVQVTGSGTDQTDPNAIREPTVDEVRKEWQGHVETLRDQLKGMADQRTLRLREIAIDTAIRNSGSNIAAQIGSAAATTRIIQDAAVYYAFLDTGAVPA